MTINYNRVNPLACEEYDSVCLDMKKADVKKEY